MEKYSINKISNDVCEFLIVIESSVIYGFLDRIGLNELKDELLN